MKCSVIYTGLLDFMEDQESDRIAIELEHCFVYRRDNLSFNNIFGKLRVHPVQCLLMVQMVKRINELIDRGTT